MNFKKKTNPYIFILSIFPYSLWLLLDTKYVLFIITSLLFLGFLTYHMIRYIYKGKDLPPINSIAIIILFSLLMNITNIGERGNTPCTYGNIASVSDYSNANTYKNEINETYSSSRVNSIFKLESGIDIPNAIENYDNQIIQLLNEKANFIYFEEKPQVVNKICYFAGAGYSLNIDILASSGKDAVYKIASYSNEYPKVFEWVCSTFSEILTDKIYLVSKTPEIQPIGEIRAFYNDVKLNIKSNIFNLTDENSIYIPDRQTYMNSIVFDEIYHARAAFEFMDGLNVYENTHPPLGKMIIELGIKIFGFSPFGWRIASAIFGIFSLYFAFLLIYFITNNKNYGLFAAIILSSSWMHLVQSRLGLIDIFSTTILLLSVVFFYLFIDKKKYSFLYLSAVFLGLSAGVKWSAIFVSASFLLLGLLFLFLEKNRKVVTIVHACISFFIVTPLFYLSTFYQYFFFRNFSFIDIMNYNKDAYLYHSLETSTHPSSSLWWEWVLNLRTLPMFTLESENGSSMLILGESNFLAYSAFISILVILWISIKKRTYKKAFLPAIYLSLLAPYIFIGRTLFSYHYSYSLFFAIISIVYASSLILKKEKTTILFLFIFVGYVQFNTIYNYNELTGQLFPGKADLMSTSVLLQKGFN